MKIIAINIPPKDKSHYKLCSSDVEDSERSDKVIETINNEKPDVVFLIEQYGPVYELVKKSLQFEYNFITPSEFKPSERSYAGVVAGVKKSIKVSEYIDGNALKIGKSAKILGLCIDHKWFLGVHYPQPSCANDTQNNFDKKVKEFVASEDVQLLIGDFNPKRGTNQHIDGFKDAINDKGATSLFETKLDYVFIPNSTDCHEENIIFDASVMDQTSDSFFSDHALIGIKLD